MDFLRSSPFGLGASRNAGRGGDEGIISSLTCPGVGDWTSICVAKYGCLCGRGEMSILSSNGPGEDDGMGGVVTQSRPSIVPNKFEVKRDLRGVGN